MKDFFFPLERHFHGHDVNDTSVCIAQESSEKESSFSARHTLNFRPWIERQALTTAITLSAILNSHWFFLRCAYLLFPGTANGGSLSKTKMFFVQNISIFNFKSFFKRYLILYAGQDYFFGHFWWLRPWYMLIFFIYKV